MTIAGETLEGEQVEKTILLPLGAAADGKQRLLQAGTAVRVEGNKVYFDHVVFGSPARTTGAYFAWEILHLDVEADRPPKQIMFIALGEPWIGKMVNQLCKAKLLWKLCSV